MLYIYVFIGEGLERLKNTAERYDVVVIGGGVTGCAIARELARYELSVCLLEKCEDVCSGTSKANSAIVHAGFDAMPGSMKAKMNVLGSRMMPALSRELDFSFRVNGALVLCFSEEEIPALEELKQRGERNGVEGLRIVYADELRAMEKNVSGEAVAALYAPTSGIVCPFGLTIALAENAYENGVEFRFNTRVENIARAPEGFEIATSQGKISSRYGVNAAGVYADVIHNMVSSRKMQINPRKGDYCLLDRECGGHVRHTVFHLPDAKGKGVLVTPTVHGNLLVGPTATEVSDREATATTAADLQSVIERSARSIRSIPFNQVITSFSGLRACCTEHDFILGEAEDCEGFFDAAGIESPGLSSAPAIGEYMARLVAEKSGAKRRENFNPVRRGIVHLAELNDEERAEMIRRNPLYGSIVCRCEQISEGEIVDAIRRPLGAKSLDGVKRRVRAGMGRCQAGFCTPRTMEILARELNVDITAICKNVPGSELLTGKMEGDEIG